MSGATNEATSRAATVAPPTAAAGNRRLAGCHRHHKAGAAAPADEDAADAWLTQEPTRVLAPAAPWLPRTSPSNSMAVPASPDADDGVPAAAAAAAAAQSMRSKCDRHR